MSLNSLRDLRRARRRPDEVIQIIVGPKPRWRDDTAGIVHIPVTATPEEMDWRPVVGLWVAVFVTCSDWEFGKRVLDQLEAAGARLFGAADPQKTYAMAVGADEGHHASLKNSMELLCQP